VARAREPSEKETRTQNRYEIDYYIIIFVGKRGKIDQKDGGGGGSGGRTLTHVPTLSQV